MNLEIANAILDMLDELESRVCEAEATFPNWAAAEWGEKMRKLRERLNNPDGDPTAPGKERA
jgi:hypothetical protein